MSVCSENKIIRVGIVGYGNLGKSLEKLILTDTRFKLVAIFSRRLISSKFGTLVENYGDFGTYEGKIDVMLLAGGSKSDLEFQTPEVLKYFDCINTFDNHKKIYSELVKNDEIAKASGHRLIMCCGWDPGIFSIIRAIFKAVGSNNPITFWGKGVSMGHSEAIRRVDGVLDGVSLTIPSKEAKQLAEKKGIIDASVPLHSRVCYVSVDSSKISETEIERKIKNIPDYFKGQPVSVNFVSAKKVLYHRKNLSHKGEIIEQFMTGNKSNNKMKFSVQMQSNSDFTASIVICYILAIMRLKSQNKTGAFTPVDIPVSYFFYESEMENFYKSLC